MTDKGDGLEWFNVDRGVEQVVGELHALLRGDTDFAMAEGDVELFPGGEEFGQFDVDIRNRRYRITVEDIGSSAREMARVIDKIMGRRRP